MESWIKDSVVDTLLRLWFVTHRNRKSLVACTALTKLPQNGLEPDLIWASVVEQVVSFQKYWFPEVVIVKLRLNAINWKGLEQLSRRE